MDATPRSEAGRVGERRPRDRHVVVLPHAESRVDPVMLDDEPKRKRTQSPPGKEGMP